MYRFRLQALLKHRQHEQEVLQRELALVRRRLLAEQKVLHAQKASLRRHQRELQLGQAQGRRVAEILLVTEYLGKLTRDLDEQHKRVSAAEQEFQKTRGDLIKAVKKRRVLEKLKQRQWERYEQQVRKKDRDAMDEAAAARFQRNIQTD